jgi:hypothetical protein
MAVEDISPDNIPDDLRQAPDPTDALFEQGGPGETPIGETGLIPKQNLPHYEKTAAEPGQIDQNEPEPPTGEAPAEEPAEENIEREIVKELGLGEYDTLSEAVAARDQTVVTSIKGLFPGLDLRGQSAQEVLAELDAIARQQAAQAPREPEPEPVKAGELKFDEIFSQFEDNLDVDESTRGLLSSIGNRVHQAVAEQVRDAQSRAEALQGRLDYMQDRMWYSELKAEAGDDPIPPFDEARRLLQQNPKLREDALYRMQIFGDDRSNPMTEAARQWRTAKTGTGLTKAEAQQRALNAEKLARMRKQVKPGAPPRPSARTAQEVSNQELSEAMHNIPIGNAFPRR